MLHGEVLIGTLTTLVKGRRIQIFLRGSENFLRNCIAGDINHAR